jgi:hypothetical protein
MSYLPAFKIGDCSCGCGGKDVQGRKVGKSFYCMRSYKSMKTKQYTQKANLNNKIRNLGNVQVQEGNYEDASVQALKNDLDWVVSRYIRMLYADAKNGFVKCYTCPTIKHFSLMHNGHYIPRANTQTRWLLKNLRPQCPTCNEAKHGNLEVFEQRLEEEEKGITEYLEAVSREVYKYSRDELKQLLTDMRAKLRLVETKFKQSISKI